MIHNSKSYNWWGKYKDITIVFFLYLLLALIFTWPVITKIGTVIYGQAGDPLYNLWVFHNLRFGDLMVNQPYGLTDLNHILQPNQPLIDFIAKYLTIIFDNEISSYNVMIILSFPLAGLAIYLLAKTLTQSSYSSFFAGLIFAFSPYHLAHAQFHISLSSIYWLGFFVYFLIKSHGENNYKNWGLTGLFFALTTMDNYQYGYFAAIILVFSILYMTTYHWVKNKKIYLNNLAVKHSLFFIIIAISLLTIFNYNLVKSFFSSSGISSFGPNRNYQELTTYSAHLFNYFYPSPQNPIFGDISQGKFSQSINSLKSNLTEQTLYLGWIPLLLSIFGIWKVINLKSHPPRLARGEDGISNLKTYVWFFVILALVGLYFSFAPSVNLFGLTINTPAHYVFKYLPVIRVYARFGLIVNLAITVLAGIGLSLLISNVKKSLFKNLLLVACYLLLFVEFTNFPPLHYFDVSNSALPQVYQVLKQQPKGIIAEYPLLPTQEPKGYSYLLWQRYHQFPLVYGAPDLSAGDDFRKLILNIGDQKTIDKLQEIGVKYIIIHDNEYTLTNAQKFPEEYNDGKIPIVNSDKLEIISRSDGDILYRIRDHE